MITAQIASLPDRVVHLSKTVASLIDQVDSLFVGLNCYDSVPEFLIDNPKITYKLMDNSLGDGAKFHNSAEIDGYVLTCDDDLIYPQGYASYMVDGIKRHGGIVTVLGKVYADRPIGSFGTGYTRLYSCLNRVHRDTPVDVAGTGVMAYHSDAIKIDPYTFPRKNMADVWVAKQAHEEDVKMTVLAHPRQYVIYNKFEWRIWTQDRDDAYQTAIVNNFLK